MYVSTFAKFSGLACLANDTAIAYIAEGLSGTLVSFGLLIQSKGSGMCIARSSCAMNSRSRAFPNERRVEFHPYCTCFRDICLDHFAQLFPRSGSWPSPIIATLYQVGYAPSQDVT